MDRDRIAAEIKHLAASDLCRISIDGNRVADRIFNVQFVFVTIWVVGDTEISKQINSRHRRLDDLAVSDPERFGRNQAGAVR